MKEKIYYSCWLVLFVLCAGLGTITQRTTGVSVVLTIWSIAFFVPGGLLLYEGIKTNNRKMLLRLRLVSLSSLVITVVMIVLNIMAVQAPETIGTLLNTLLVIFSTPMFCCAFQGISLFLWACLFVGSFPRIWQK